MGDTGQRTGQGRSTRANPAALPQADYELAQTVVDAKVRIEAHERDGLERLLRTTKTCTRPAFALERLREIDPEHLVYESVKPGPGGSVSRMLNPMQLRDRLRR